MISPQVLTVQWLHSEVNGRRRDISGREAIAAASETSACRQLTHTVPHCSSFCSLEVPGCNDFITTSTTHYPCTPLHRHFSFLLTEGQRCILLLSEAIALFSSWVSLARDQQLHIPSFVMSASPMHPLDGPCQVPSLGKREPICRVNSLWQHWLLTRHPCAVPLQCCPLRVGRKNEDTRILSVSSFLCAAAGNQLFFLTFPEVSLTAMAWEAPWQEQVCC